MAHLTAQKVAQFREQGYLVIDDLLSPTADLDPIIAEYEGVLAQLAEQLYAAGEISSPYAELPFGPRLTQIYAESGRAHTQFFDFTLPQSNIKHDTPIWVGPAVFRTLINERLLDAVEALIGPEIYSNPVQHVRIKPPERVTPRNAQGQPLVGVTPWHQDNGVVLPEADESEIITVWFPLNDATVENGCLQVIPYSHHEGIITHCPGSIGGLTNGLSIPEKLLDTQRAVPVPLRRGGVLFMHRRMCHASLPNQSDDIRWSFDLRYNPIGQATGRSAFPGFVARSKAQPATALRDPGLWAQRWYATREQLAAANDHGPFNRWRANAPACA